ncbi:MAG: hypothetical protein COU40_02130 [Candidatus Moranbacteria bacterium CG10_big_fil_rev_8_21_14_0_10_35_21]|nr:MAG: hypothetical protein COU40_02130 [Candidatus Moranbacteria bacterium CG10_big_fil_rev_8_21_14_0_10_35_21]PJA88585.1 MAG: hypothetical protein CO139_02230 [Candidatus Moranbacteria bacterium CG_4_9_14_3_um_filter_36_9]
MQQEKNQSSLLLTIGIFLILLVAAITVFRSFKNPPPSNQTTSSQNKSSQTESKKSISPEELSKKIQNREPLSIIDIRFPEEFQKEHLVGAKNYDLEAIGENLDQLSKNQTLVIIDQDGISTAKNFAEIILPAGDLNNAVYLTGGFIAWKNQFYSTISDGDPNSFVDQSKVSYLSSEALKELMTKETNLVFIDLRNEKDFQIRHLTGARNIFLESLEEKNKEIPLGKKIILYDKDSFGSFKGAVRLFDLGIFNVSALSDGFETLKEKGFSIEP